MSAHRRRLVFVVLVAACGMAAVAAIAAGVRSEEPRVATSDAARQVLADAQAEGRKMVLYRSLEPEGQLAVAPVGGGEPTFEPLSCDRVYFAAGRGLCVARAQGITTGFSARVFGPDIRVQHEIALDGVPSRARVSPDGRYGSVTMFVTGHSYNVAGRFSTTTTLIDLERGEELATLEEFTVTRGGRKVTAVDVNFWGVTFAPGDSDRFYATMATGGRTYLIEGSLSRRVARVLRENVECPSLSPDGTRIAFKFRMPSAKAPWRLSVLDLETMRETRLAETRSIDDQAEWLDDTRVLYGVDGQVYAVPADGGGEPERFLGTADSPAVVRW